MLNYNNKNVKKFHVIYNFKMFHYKISYSNLCDLTYALFFYFALFCVLILKSAYWRRQRVRDVKQNISLTTVYGWWRRRRMATLDCQVVATANVSTTSTNTSVKTMNNLVRSYETLLRLRPSPMRQWKTWRTTFRSTMHIL